MRIKSKLVIIVLAILVLLGVFVALSINSNDLNDGTSVENNENDTGIEIMNVESDLQTFSVYGIDESYKLDYTEGIWNVADSFNVKLNQGLVASVTRTAKFLYADSLVAENISDLSIYGMDNPSLTIVMTDTENNVNKISFGIQTGTKSGYYTTVNDEDDIYIVSTDIYNSLNGGLSSIRNKTIVNLTEEVTGITINNEKSAFTIQTKTSENVNANDLTDWEMVTPYLKDVNQSIFEEKIINILNFTISEFVDDNPSDYSKYGLENPKYFITINTASETYNVLLGNDKDAGSIYMKMADEPNVYAISKDLVEYRDYTPVYLLESYVFIRKIIATDNIVFNVGENYVLKVNDPDFYVNDKKVDETLFRSTFETIISPVISGEADASRVGKELCRFTFNYNTNTPAETVVYYEYGDMYAAASVNGDIDFYVKRSFVDNMINAVKKLAE